MARKLNAEQDKPGFIWAVMSTVGIMAWLNNQAAAEREAAWCQERFPDVVVWVAPWPELLAAYYPESPWLEMAGLTRPPRSVSEAQGPECRRRRSA